MIVHETGENLLELIATAGVVGAGGAGFPTHIKLDVKLTGGTVIANGVECEPVIGHNVYLMENYPEKIIRGLQHAMEITGATRGVLAVKAKNQRAAKGLAQAIRDRRLTIKMLPDIYPMGEERALVREILGVLLQPQELPKQAGAVVSNVETLMNISRAIDEKRPVISKWITLAGRLKEQKGPYYLEVPVGAPVTKILADHGGVNGEIGEILLGGPFMGSRGTLDSIISKNTGGVLVTIPFPKEKRPLGLLECACGADEFRLRQIAHDMGAEVVGVTRCKQAFEVRERLKCENPGKCPGQAGTISSLKKMGAKAVLLGTCSDCTNTAMEVARKMDLTVYHHTDHVMRTMGIPLIRRFGRA